MSLRDLARVAGIDANYTDWRGQPTSASDESLRQALHALAPDLGVDVTRGDAAAELEKKLWSEVVPDVVVAWDGMLRLPFQVPADVDSDWSCEVTTEEGGTFRASGRLFHLPADGHAHPGGRVHCIRRAELYLEGQLGYHTVRWSALGQSGEAMVIGAPTNGYGRPGHGFRRWGVFAPVYGLASPRSGQTGDLETLRHLMEQVDKRGGSYVAVLPLLAAFLDECYAFSPYSPASRLFWNELYLDLHKLGDALDTPIPTPPAIVPDAKIDYRAHYAFRRPIIEQLARGRFSDANFAGGVDVWARQKGAWDYAAFRAIGEATRTGWRSWPAELRDHERPINTRAEAIELAARAPGATLDSATTRVDTHAFAQFQMQTQLEQLQGGRVGLYLDLPVGVNCDAYEVWRHRGLFLLPLAAGAPPDALFLGGQNWGLPPLSPYALRKSRYRYFIDCVRHHMSVAGMLRIDHVMGLFRLYCVPEGRPATDGVYLRYHHEELIAILTLESLRSCCIIAGEDLGTVPDHIRPTMTRHGMFRLHVGQWSFPQRTGQRPTPSPAEAVASLNTHDTATFAGWWRGADIADKRDLKLIDERAEHAERQVREREKTALLAFAPPSPTTDKLTDVERAMVAATTDLATGPAEIVLVSLDDLALDPVPQNVPGTVEERPNWQRRTAGWATSLDEDRASPAAAVTIAALVAARPPMT